MVGPKSDSKGGIATVIANFKEYYSGENQVSYLATWTEKHKFSTGIKAVLTLRKIIRKNKIDVVHFHVAQKSSFYRKALLAKLVPRRTKVIFHMHASQFDTFYKLAGKKAKKKIQRELSRLDGLVVLSEEWAAFYEQITDAPIEIIENAVMVEEQPKYNPRATEIITLGRLGKRKGSYDILHVAKQLESEFPNVCFTLFGDGEIEEVEREMEALASQNVRLGGWLLKEDRDEIVAGTVLHLLPSYQEGLPMSILETMSEGIPNLASDVGGIPQVIQDGENGMLIKPGDISSMVEKLRYFLTDEKLREKLSQASYEKIKTDFSLEKYFEKWDRYYESLLEEESQESLSISNLDERQKEWS